VGGGDGTQGIAVASPGQDNTGGGGGGSGNNYNGAAGGSGIVIISYPDSYPALASTSGSPTVSTSGSGSISFNGSSQYLTMPTSANLALGTSSFTVEYWVYLTSNSGSPIVLTLGAGSVTYDGLFGYYNAGSTNLVWYLSSNGSAWDIVNGITGTVSLNTWTHVAFVRNSNTFTMYVNGTSAGTSTSSASVYQSANSILIGYGQGAHYFPGYISNARVVKGTAIYTANFTPPTAPLTAVTNTQLLFNTVSGAPFVDASSNSFASTATGSPTWNQLSPFATGLGYKNRVYTWSSTGSGAFTV
jgi:hypothetical protein